MFKIDLGGAVFGSVNAFLQQSASRDGYAKANRYEVLIFLPTGASGTSSQDAGDAALNGNILKLRGEVSRRISFRCDTISIPGRNLRTQMNGNIYGPPHEMVQGQTFAPISASFYCGTDMAERYFFEEWQKVSYNPDTYNVNYYKEYVGALEIYQLDEQDNRTYGIRLEEAFPKTIGEIAYGHASSNQINKVNIEFAYRHWRNLGTEPERGNQDSTLQDLLKNSIARQISNQIPTVLRRLFFN